METVYEGTWEEVAAHAPELAGRRVRLEVMEAGERTRRLRQGIEKAREIARDFPAISERRITLDFLYPDEETS